MRKLVVATIAAALLVTTGAIALAALPVTVAPNHGSPTTKFRVDFDVDRQLSADRWYSVEVVSAVTRNDCEHQESATVSYAPKGNHVAVMLRPVDKLRWCEGVYRGTVHLDHRIGCGNPGPDLGPCSVKGPTVARFSFTVKP